MRWPGAGRCPSKTRWTYDHVGLHSNSSIYLAMREAAAAAGAHHPAAHPRDRPRRHVPHDRQRPGRGRDAAPRLQLMHGVGELDCVPLPTLGQRAASTWWRATSPPCPSRRAAGRPPAGRAAGRAGCPGQPLHKITSTADKDHEAPWDAPSTTRSGTSTSSTPKKTAPPSSTSTATWCTKSPARRPSKACARPAARSGASARSSPPPTTTRPPPAGSCGYDGITDPISKEQVTTLDKNIAEFGAAAYFPFLSKRQGIVHVIGPEQGATLPGMTVVCGDSHTSTHGAFGALAHGIGTSEVEHVMATQTLLAKKAKNMLSRSRASWPPA
jgi:hypothetical protein